MYSLHGPPFVTEMPVIEIVIIKTYLLRRSSDCSVAERICDADACRIRLCWLRFLQLLEASCTFSLNYSNVQMAAFAPSYAVSVGNCILLSRHFILRFCCRRVITVLFLNLSLLILEFRYFGGMFESPGHTSHDVSRRSSHFKYFIRLLWNLRCKLYDHHSVLFLFRETL